MKQDQHENDDFTLRFFGVRSDGLQAQEKCS